MESIKMVLMNLFAGQQWRCRHGEQTCGLREGKERAGQMERVAWKHTRYHMWNRQQWEFAVWHRELSQCSAAAERGRMGGRREAGSRGRGHTYPCGWLMLTYDRNRHNIVKQLSSNKFFFKNKEIMPFAATWMDLQITILSEIRQRISYDITYMRNLKKWYKWVYSQTTSQT